MMLFDYLRVKNVSTETVALNMAWKVNIFVASIIKGSILSGSEEYIRATA